MTANDPRTREIAAAFGPLPGVIGVALAGSGVTGVADERSDTDLYVYVRAEPPGDARAAIARRFAADFTIGNRYWGLDDDWLTADGRAIDVMYRWPDWIAGELDRVLVHHQPSVGYSTATWHSVRTATPLHDPEGYVAGLIARADVPYPEPLRRAIVAHNRPLLRETRFSFAHQVEIAVARGDWVSVQHRAATLLASYFDVLFALNRRTHPGEKRLLTYAPALPIAPPDIAQDVIALLTAASPPGSDTILPAIHRLVDGLDTLVRAEGLPL